MIAGIFHEGSGLGDQLFRYITVRTLAENKGYRFAMYHPDKFKGDFFEDIHLGYNPINDGGEFSVWNEKDIRDENGIDIRSYDPEINFVEDNTIIDGSFEDSKYWHHNLKNIDKWLAVEPAQLPDNYCVIGFRGGEYATQPDLFLEPDYWKKARDLMGDDKFYEVHTDDPERAKQWFPSTPVVENERISHSKHTNMGLNWRTARYAKYAIIPNSAFFIIPRLLKHQEDPEAITIAPRYWARRNTKTWARPACFYEEFTYI